MFIATALAALLAEAADNDGEGSTLLVLLGIAALVAGIWFFRSRRHSKRPPRRGPGEQPAEFIEEPTSTSRPSLPPTRD